MKKVSLLLALAVTGLTSFAQYNATNVNTEMTEGLPGVDESVHFTNNDNSQNRSVNAPGDVLWIEDFSGLNGALPAGWKADNAWGGGTWYVESKDVGQEGAYTKAKNVKLDTDGYVTLPADFYNCIPGSNPLKESGSSKDVDATLTTADIDVKAFNTEGVTLQFKTAFRYCCSPKDTKLEVMVSADKGTTWEKFDATTIDGTEYPINVGIDPSMWSEDITSIIAGKDQVRFAFRMSGGSHYYWSIDDISMVGRQPNDVNLVASYASFYSVKTISYGQVHTGGFMTSYHNSQLAKVPFNISHTLHLGALLHQAGVKGDNTTVNYKVTKDGADFWSGGSIDSKGVKIILKEFLSRPDTVIYSDTTKNHANGPVIYDPTYTQAANFKDYKGIPYQITYSAVSDNADFNLDDNKDTFNLEQTFGLFSYSHQPTVQPDLKKIGVHGPFNYVVDKTDGDIFATQFYLGNDDNTELKIHGVRVFFKASDDYLTFDNGIGATFVPVIYYWDNAKKETVEVEDVTGEPYTLVGTDVDTYVYFEFDEDEVKAYDFEPHYYYVGLKVQSYNGQKIAFGVDNTIRQARSHFWQFALGDKWGAGYDAGGSVMMDVYTQRSQMTYDKDVNMGVKNVVKNSNNVKVYPNPTTGLVKLKNVENATINVYSLSGTLVKTVQSTSVNSSVDLTGLAKGTYFVQVVKENEVVTKKISLLK